MTQTNDGWAADLTTDGLKRLAASITPGEWDCEVLTATDEIGDEWATDVEVGSVSGAPIHAHDLGYSDDTDRRIIANARAIALVPALLRELIERREADAGMRALLRAGCDLLADEYDNLKASITMPDGSLSDDPLDAWAVKKVAEMEDWIASVKATLYPATEAGHDE